MLDSKLAFAFFFQLSFTFLPFITSILLLDDQFASFLNIRLDIGDALVLHIIQHDGWAIIGLHRSEAHIIYFYAIHVAGVETEGWSFFRKSGLRVVGALFSIFLFRQFCLATATILQADIAQRDVAEWQTRHTGNDDAGKGIYIVGNDIADHDVATGRNGGALLRTTVSATGGNVDRVVVNMIHGDIIHHDILHQSLIDFLESQTAAIHKGAVAQRNIPVSAIRFRAELEAAAYPVYLFRNISAIQECAKLVTRNHTVGNGDMLC